MTRSAPTDRDDSSPLVSVVLPTYGRSSYLGEALRSVNEQTYDNIELLVVDDHSPEPVLPVVEDCSLDSLTSVRCLRHEENRGASAARNTGIRAACGEYVSFLDDDDRWLAQKVQRQVAAFENAAGDVGVVYSGQRYVDGDGTTTNVRLPAASGNFTENLIRGKPFGPFSVVMVRSEVIDVAGDLDERFPSWQDREWYFRLAEHCDFASVREPLVLRRYAGHEQISDDFEAKRDISYPLLLEKHRSLAAEYGPTYERELVATYSRMLAMAAFKSGYRRDAIDYLRRAIAARPTAIRPYLYLVLVCGGDVTYRPARALKQAYNQYISGVLTASDARS